MDSDSPTGNEEVLAALRNWVSSEPRLSLSRRFREASADSAGLLLDDGSAFRLALAEPERDSESGLPVHLLHILNGEWI